MIPSHYLEGLDVFWILTGCALTFGLAVGYLLGIWRERRSWTKRVEPK